MTILLVTLFLAVLATYLCTPLFETELYQNLTVGHWIETHRAVPLWDYWNHSDQLTNGVTAARGIAPASDAHLVGWNSTSWLFDVGTSMIEHAFGVEGLLWLKVGLYFVAICGFAWLYVSRSQNLLFGVFVASAVSCGVLLHAALSPQLALFALLGIWIELALRLVEGRKQSGAWSLLIFLSLFAAQIHPLICFSVCFLPAVVSDHARPGLLIRWVALVFVAVVTSMLTPYFGGQVGAALREIRIGIFQGAPATIYQFSACFLVLLAVLLLLLLFERRQRMPRLQTVAAIGVGYVGFARMECTPFAIFFFGLLVCVAWGTQGGVSDSNLLESIELLAAKLRKFPRQGVIWVLGCLCFVNAVKLQKVPQSTLLLPSKEVDFLLEHRPQSSVLYPPDIEPYMMYRGTDGSGEPMPDSLRRPPAVSGRKDALQKIFGLQFGWEQPFREFAPKVVITRYNSPLYTFLSGDTMWSMLMRNGVNLLHPDPNAPQHPLTEYSWAVFALKTPLQYQPESRRGSAE